MRGRSGAGRKLERRSVPSQRPLRRGSDAGPPERPRRAAAPAWAGRRSAGATTAAAPARARRRSEGASAARGRSGTDRTPAPRASASSFSRSMVRRNMRREGPLRCRMERRSAGASPSSSRYGAGGCRFAGESPASGHYAGRTPVRRNVHGERPLRRWPNAGLPERPRRATVPAWDGTRSAGPPVRRSKQPLCGPDTGRRSVGAIAASGHSGASQRRSAGPPPAGAIAASGRFGADQTPVHRSVRSEWSLPRGPDAGPPGHPGERPLRRGLDAARRNPQRPLWRGPDAPPPERPTRADALARVGRRSAARVRSGAGRTSERPRGPDVGPPERPPRAVAPAWTGCRSASASSTKFRSVAGRTPVRQNLRRERPLRRGMDVVPPERPRPAVAPALAGCRSVGESPASSHSSADGCRSAGTSSVSGHSHASGHRSVGASATCARSGAGFALVCWSVASERPLRCGLDACPPERQPRAATPALAERQTAGPPASGRSGSGRIAVRRSVPGSVPGEQPLLRRPDTGPRKHPLRVASPARAGHRSAGATAASDHFGAGRTPVRRPAGPPVRRSAGASATSSRSGAGRTPEHPARASAPARTVRVRQSVLRERSLRRGPYGGPLERPPRATTPARFRRRSAGASAACGRCGGVRMPVRGASVASGRSGAVRTPERPP